MARTNLKVTDGIAIDFYDDGNSNKGSIYLDNGAFVFSGTSGGDVVIGEVGNGADLVFEESSTIHGQGGNTLTFGQSGDSIVFAVDTTFNANIDSNGIIRLSADGSASNHFLSIGDGDDFKIYHDSNDTRIRNFTGNLVIANEGNDKDIIFQNDNNSGGMTDWIALDGSEFKTLFKVDTRHQDDIKQYWGSGNDTFAYYNSSTLDFEIQHSGDMFYITHSGGVGSNRKIAFNLRNQIVFQDRADGNAELFSFDMNARTMTVGKDNHGVSLNIYGDVAGEYTTLYRNYDFTAGSKTTLKLMTADQSVYIVGHRTAADAGSNLEFDVTNSSGVRVPGMIINEAADIRFHEGVYIGTGADSGNTDHIRLLGSSTLFNRNTEHQDGVYAYFGADADASLYHDDTDFHIQNTKGHLDIINSGSDIRLQSAGNVTIELDTNQDGNNYFRIMDGNDNTDFIVAENLATFPYTYGIRYYYDVTSNYDFTTAVTDDGIEFSTASNTRDFKFKAGSAANTQLQIGDTQVTVGFTDGAVPLAISRYANTGTYDDLGVIQPAAASAGIGINYHNGTAFALGFKLTKTGAVDLTQSKLTIAGATGTNGQVLTTDGAGNISWTSAAGGGDAYLANNQTFTGSNTFSTTANFFGNGNRSLGWGDTTALGALTFSSSDAVITSTGTNDLIFTVNNIGATFLRLDQSANVLYSYKQSEFQNHVGIADGYDLYVRGNEYNEGLHLYDGSSPVFTYSVVTSASAVGRHSSSSNSTAYMYNYPVGTGYYGNSSTSAYHMEMFAADLIRYDVSQSSFSGMKRMEDLKLLEKDKKVFNLHNPYMSDVNIEISEALARIKRLERELLKEKNINKDYQERLARLEDLILI